MGEGEEPLSSQFFKTRPKTTTPPLFDRVLVFDCKRKTVHVQSEKEVVKCELVSTVTFPF